MSELEANLSRLTGEWEGKTERELLKEENKMLKAKIKHITQKVLGLDMSDRDMIVEQMKKLKSILCGQTETEATISLQSIWRALKVRRKFRQEKRTAIQAIITIQRHYKIYM